MKLVPELGESAVASRTISLLLVAVAALGHGASWAYPGLWWSAWPGHIGLAALAVTNRPRAALIYGYLAGFFVNAWAFHWAPAALQLCFDAPWLLSQAIFLLLVLWESVEFALFCGLLAIATRTNARGIWLAPFAWTAIEHAWPKIFPWLIAYSQLELLPLLQIAEIVGACGVGFVMTAACAIPAALILARLRRDDAIQRRTCLRYVGASCALLIATLAYGQWKLQEWDHSSDEKKTFRLAVLQVDTSRKDCEDKLLELTKQVDDEVDLVCWPESAIGTYALELQSFGDLDRTRELSRQSFETLRPTLGARCDVLVGGRTYRPHAGPDGPYAMTAFLIDREETIRGQYHKRTLLPFGEYIPFQDYFPQLREWATLTSVIESGDDARPLTSSTGAKLGTVICYEDLLRENARHTVQAGAELLISIINDSAFENPLTLEQHRRLAAMRAVENRRYFVRCAGTGVSCVISPTGKVIGELPIKEEKMLQAEISLFDETTFYTRFGDVFANVCLMVVIVGLWMSRRRHAGREQHPAEAGA